MEKNSIDGWIKKTCYIYTMEHYSVIKRSKIESSVETYMDLKTLLQNEVSHKEKKKIFSNAYV